MPIIGCINGETPGNGAMRMDAITCLSPAKDLLSYLAECRQWVPTETGLALFVIYPKFVTN